MKRMRGLVSLAFALVLSFVLVACGGNTSSSTDTPAEGAAASTEAQTAGLVGKPWVTSILQGNLPPEAPEAKDDLYTHYAYDYLTQHQVSSNPMMPDSAAMTDHMSEFKDGAMSVIKDGSKQSPELEQLRILYDQAADTKRLQETGLKEVQPYLDRIDAVETLDELNALLSADDFPFSPFINAIIKTIDTRTTNIVGIAPNFLLSDALLTGGLYYQDTDDPTAQQAAQTQLMAQGMITGIDFMAAGMDVDSAKAAVDQLTAFEKQHGKFYEYSAMYLKQDFGALAESSRTNVCTLDELCDLCPNYPIKETLAKMKKDGSNTYTVYKPWIAAFNDLWTNENLDVIKLMARAKVLAETRPYRCQMTADAEGNIIPAEDDSDTFAWQACDNMNTFGQLLGKVYVTECMPANSKENLTQLSEQIISTYKDLIRSTAWMSEDSKKSVIEKLDNMTLNVLEPTGGYFDYSGIELTPTDKGGTLFSNYLACKQYRYDCEARLVGAPAIAASPWFSLTPSTLNAFYDGEGNSINILPGFTTTLTYGDKMANEDLLAGIGFAIAHEVSHGFDYLGAQLDAYGQPNHVYSDADVDKFLAKAAALAEYYSGIELQPDVMVDGQNVVAEAGADLSGMQVIMEIASKTDGFDYVKFYESMSKVWAQVLSQGTFPIHATDSHPLNNLRINVNSQMFDPLYDTLGVAEGDGMYLAPEKRLVMWGPKA